MPPRTQRDGYHHTATVSVARTRRAGASPQAWPPLWAKPGGTSAVRALRVPDEPPPGRASEAGTAVRATHRCARLPRPSPPQQTPGSHPFRGRILPCCARALQPAFLVRRWARRWPLAPACCAQRRQAHGCAGGRASPCRAPQPCSGAAGPHAVLSHSEHLPRCCPQRLRPHHQL